MSHHHHHHKHVDPMSGWVAGWIAFLGVIAIIASHTF
jgi:hypothetical protein